MSSTDPAPPAETPPPAHHGKLLHRIGVFIEKYSTFLSSFVLGLAGLIGTALYQSQNTKIAQKQAEAQIEVSRNQAETQWKIARAEILSKNLQVLLDKKPETTDQRYGVLLSLTREDVLDPELAMSYAFDLDNADYIKSVILNIQNKSWAQIFHNFKMTCDLRFGVRREVPVCRAIDKYEARSEAMADVVAEELTRGSKDPFKLLADEKVVKKNLMRLVYLFEPYLAQVYSAERLSDIDSFEKQGRGAQIVAAFVLAGDPGGDSFVADNHAAERARFHEVRQKKLTELLTDPNCDVDCKGQGAELLLNGLEDYGSIYARVMIQLLGHLGTDSTQVMQRLHRRLLWCQTSRAVADRMLRDVLIPAWNEVQQGKSSKEREHEKEVIVELASLIEPAEDLKPPESLVRAWNDRRARAKKDREAPPPTLKKSNFCAARDDESRSGDQDL